MCLKISFLLRALALVCALICVSLVAAGLSSVAPAAGATKGCYFHHPDSAVCIYIEAVSVATVAITLVFGIVDYCLSVRRKRGKRFKKIDIVASIFMALLWVSCGGTMAGFASRLSTADRDLYTTSTVQMANSVIVISWVCAVTWLVVVLAVCCSAEEPESSIGLFPEATDEDKLATSAENKPLLRKP